MVQNTPTPEGNREQLYELALRLLAPPLDPEADQPQLLAGSLPSALPSAKYLKARSRPVIKP